VREHLCAADKLKREQKKFYFFLNAALCLYFKLENALKVKLLLALFMSMPFFSAMAQHSHAGQTPYAGMQNRAIKSLSDNDINELRRGGGWGLALVAELNGMPGPSHLLELKDKIPLASDQVDKTQVLLDEMRKAAIPAGERLIAAEKALESAFVSGKVDEISLRRLLADAESARSELRFIHLSQHYKTVQFLKPEQIKRYNILRGYADDPCENIPAGHNPEMYKRHMGCN
jgi:hypothetical protein